jgi:hypothetical protein
VYLDERLRECVSFLFIDVADGGAIVKWPIGTTFFLLKSLATEDEVETSSQIDNSHDCFVAYSVTAAHVIKESIKCNPIYIRINKRDGTYYDQPTDPRKWIRDDASDVAIYEVGDVPIDKEQQAVRCLCFPNLATDQYMESIPVTAGYEVFFLGLFAAHPGKTRAQPVIRFGNISLMRHDKIDTYLSNADAQADRKSEIDAYLVEARSWGGQSGSPALFYYPPLEPSSSPLWIRFQTPIVLGLVHSQYEHQELADTPLASAGITMVVPASKIRTLVLRRKLREKRARDLKQSKGSRPAGAPVPTLTSLATKVRRKKGR